MGIWLTPYELGPHSRTQQTTLTAHHPNSPTAQQPNSPTAQHKQKLPFLTIFLGESSPTKLEYRKKGTLILTSLLEDLVDQPTY